GEAAHTGHRKIEQDQIDLADLVEQLRDLFESPGLCDFGVLDHPCHRLAQGAAEQRMIVGNYQAVVRVAHALNLQYSRRAMHAAKSSDQALLPMNCSMTSRRCGRARCSTR